MQIYEYVVVPLAGISYADYGLRREVGLSVKSSLSDNRQAEVSVSPSEVSKTVTRPAEA